MRDAKPPSPSDWGADLHRVADRLTAISGFGELLRDGIYGFVTAEQHRVLESLTREAREAGRLFRELVEAERRKPPPPASV